MATNPARHAKANEARRTPHRKAAANAARRKRDAARLKADPVFMLKRRIRTKIAKALKGYRRNRGVGGTFAMLGYTADDLRRHLERQFLKGMTWKNYGTFWHIEHIIPQVLFDLPGEIRECWALTNLRPWPGVDNLQKAAQRLHLI